MHDTRPVVVTLALAEDDQERFDRLRAEHFPAERNHLGAHLTLFHALPGERAEAVRALVAGAARRPAFAVAVTGVRLLGRGVAYSLASRDLAELHAGLQRDVVRAFGEAVTAQDRQRLSAHVTVANKVAPERARALHRALSAAFSPSDAQAVGLTCWRYAGGPWEDPRTDRFSPRP